MWLFCCFIFNQKQFATTLEQTKKNQNLFSENQLQDLAFSKEWLNLMHYQKNILSGYSSEVDGAGFFFAKNGENDPLSELKASLNKLQNDQTVIDDKHIFCKYPSRSNWLIDNLKLTGFSDKRKNCIKLNNFTAKIGAKRLGLVFVTANIDEPASMFGHTFLRFYRDDPKIDAYRDQTVSFVANINSTNPLAYIYNGLFGGFKGKLEFIPFKSRRRSYNIVENRNMWELDLDLNENEVNKILEHIWELESTHIDYYFFDENCAYYNMRLLEIARPSLKKSDQYFYLVIPSNTINDIIDDSDILKKATFYSANLSDYKEVYLRLSGTEKKAMADLSKGKLQAIAIIPNNRKEIVISAAIFKVLMRTEALTGLLREKDQKIFKDLNQLLSTSGGNFVSTALPDYTNPTIGHHTSGAWLAYGKDSNSKFISLYYRWVLHDLYDSPLGYLPYSEIAVLSPEVRYYSDLNLLTLHKLDILKVFSMNPIETNTWVGSWYLYTGFLSLKPELDNHQPLGNTKADFASLSGDNPMSYQLRFSYGPATQFRFMPGNFGVYLLAGASFETSTFFDKTFRLSPTLSTGIIWNITDNFTGLARLDYQYSLLGQESEKLVLDGGGSIAFTRYFSLETTLEKHIRSKYYEGKVVAKFYF